MPACVMSKTLPAGVGLRLISGFGDEEAPVEGVAEPVAPDPHAANARATNVAVANRRRISWLKFDSSELCPAVQLSLTPLRVIVWIRASAGCSAV
jgi:hypothetical protein